MRSGRKRRFKMKFLKLVSTLLAALLAVSCLSLSAAAAGEVTLTFSDESIAETVAGTGYAIDGTTLTINSAGTYVIKGSCSEGSIVVSKGLYGVTLILSDLSLTSSATAPLVIKKSSTVTVQTVGNVTLTDNEDASTEETNADFEGAAIKVKGSASVTFTGSGTLNTVGNAKNGIKGGAEATLTFNEGTYVVSAANNGIGCDGEIVINGGAFSVTAENDGVKAVPDEGDVTSLGKITIYGGTFTLRCGGDGIQAGSDLLIADGSFDIQTMGGYTDSTFDKDTMSAKGLKASGNTVYTTDEDGNTVEAEAENNLTVTGGTFYLNTADDAVHSDAYCTITGGTFYIYAGDDGVHADTSLTLGEEGGYERDPEITVYSSYEGLEAGNVYFFSGKHYVTASDDGVNAAGGSSNGTDPGQGGDPFNPGGGWGPGGGHGGPGQGGGNSGASNASDYNLYVYGGDVYVDCLGDGLDSNGGLYLYGGNVTVLSQASGGDNSPFDSDGEWVISGSTVFGAGTNSMRETPASGSQKYYSATTSRNAGTVVNVSYGGSLVYSETLPRRINYLIYSSPDMTTTSCTVTTSSEVSSCNSNAWAHNWDAGCVTVEATEESVGVMTYTCLDCGATERKTIPAVRVVETALDPEPVYTATFAAEHAKINVYYTQDYTSPDEEDVTVAIARNSATGDACGTGEGQINFTVVPDDGYAVGSVTVEGSYKNLKDVSADAGLENTYRITKVAGDLTVTVTLTREVLLGDVNGDGRVNSKDVSLLKRYFVLAATDDDVVKENCDMNGDGKINSSDLAALKRLLANGE